MRHDSLVLAGVFREMGEGVLVLDCCQRLVAMNPAAERLLGWRPHDLDRLTCRVLECRDDLGRALCAEECLARRAGMERQEVGPLAMRVVTATGVVLPVLARFVPLPAADDRGTVVLLFLRDRRAEVRHEERIAHLEAVLHARRLGWGELREQVRTGWQAPVTALRLAVKTLAGMPLAPEALPVIQRMATALWASGRGRAAFGAWPKTDVPCRAEGAGEENAAAPSLVQVVRFRSDSAMAPGRSNHCSR